jgi:hypothetical protein
MVLLMAMVVCAKVYVFALRRQTRASCGEGVRQGLISLIELTLHFQGSWVLVVYAETSHLLLGSGIFARSCIALQGIVIVLSRVCVKGLLIMPPVSFPCT